MAKVKKIKKKANLSEHTVPYSSGSSIDWDNIFNELDEMLLYGKDKSPAGQRAANKPQDALAKRGAVKNPVIQDPMGYKGMVKGTTTVTGAKSGQKAKDYYKMHGPKGALPEAANMDPELAALMQKYGVNTVDEAETKVKDPTDIDWDTMFDDEPTSKGELAKPAGATNTPAASGPQSTADLKKGSRADTARATANIAPTDAMRDMMSRINVPLDDVGIDEPTQDVVPYENITPDHVPATISRAIAMTDPHAINPTWHAVSNLPGNMSRAILTLGKALFRAFTKTPTEEIVMIGNVGGQGPNSTREVNSVANWVRKNGYEVDDANIDFGQTIPGYSAQVKHYTANGIRFKIVKDQFGDYIYAWPEHDSLNQAAQIGNDEPAQRPSRALPRR